MKKLKLTRKEINDNHIKKAGWNVSDRSQVAEEFDIIDDINTKIVRRYFQLQTYSCGNGRNQKSREPISFCNFHTTRMFQPPITTYSLPIHTHSSTDIHNLKNYHK